MMKLFAILNLIQVIYYMTHMRIIIPDDLGLTDFIKSAFNMALAIQKNLFLGTK